MKSAISVFIMDITDSTKFIKPNTLTDYLKLWEKTLKELQLTTEIKVKQRMGDEIILVAENFYTAYLIAFYISINWKYKENPPYFGISQGVIDQEVKEIDLETWNHSIVKEARIGNDILKNSKIRIQHIYWKNTLKTKETELANLLLQLQGNLINEQTEKQREITSLYLLYETQKEIAKLLNKGPSTVSSQYTGGKTELITDVFNTLIELFVIQESLATGKMIAEIEKKYKLVKEKLNELMKDRIIFLKEKF